MAASPAAMDHSMHRRDEGSGSATPAIIIIVCSILGVLLCLGIWLWLRNVHARSYTRDLVAGKPAHWVRKPGYCAYPGGGIRPDPRNRPDDLEMGIPRVPPPSYRSGSSRAVGSSRSGSGYVGSRTGPRMAVNIGSQIPGSGAQSRRPLPSASGSRRQASHISSQRSQRPYAKPMVAGSQQVRSQAQPIRASGRAHYTRATAPGSDRHSSQSHAPPRLVSGQRSQRSHAYPPVAGSHRRSSLRG